MNSPGNIGHIPGKISSSFSGFTAEQLMVWTIMYSPVVLYGILPREHYEHWCVFSSACSYLCKPYISRREVNRANELLVKFCGEFEHLYGKEACTPNLHMHMHLKDCILDAGPVYTFWCFSFERYNGMLGGMNKSWCLPEQQLIHRFHNIRNLSAIDLSSHGISTELLQCFHSVKVHKNSLPDIVINSAFVLEYEKNLFCPPPTISAKKLDFHHPILPGKEKYLCEPDRQFLQAMYTTIYGNDQALTVTHVPLRYTVFQQVKVFEQLYTSCKSRTNHSSTIIAIWPHLTGILDTSNIAIANIRVGKIEYFLMHTATIRNGNADEKEHQHLLGRVSWYHDHPEKFFLQNGVLLSTKVSCPTQSASFMPVSRIISRCATLETKLQLSYGEDNVLIVVPARNSFLL